MEILEFIEAQHKVDPRESNKKRLLYYGSDFKLVHPGDKNVVKFFDLLSNDFGNNYLRFVPDIQDEKVRKTFLKLYEPEGCHALAYKIGRELPEVLRLYWGLVDVFEVKNGVGRYIQTIVHSFLHASLPGYRNRIYDPMLIGHSVAMGKVLMGANYCGVHIPYGVIDRWSKIYNQRNFSGYLKDKVFPNNKHTEEVIEELKSYQQILPPPKLLNAAH
ncbi:MAG: hypothetical protein RL641_286 [Candidatus Parcubacteria bacterium]|jgi:hypothetical protein